MCNTHTLCLWSVLYNYKESSHVNYHAQLRKGWSQKPIIGSSWNNSKRNHPLVCLHEAFFNVHYGYRQTDMKALLHPYCACTHGVILWWRKCYRYRVEWYTEPSCWKHCHISQSQLTKCFVGSNHSSSPNTTPYSTPRMIWIGARNISRTSWPASIKIKKWQAHFQVLPYTNEKGEWGQQPAIGVVKQQ